MSNDPTDHLTNGTWAGDWVLDPAASSVRFHSASFWGLVKVAGHFANLRGAGSLGPDGAVTGKLQIDAASLDTGNKRRDKHLRTDDFFDVETHPEITYTVSGITPDGPGRARVAGDLTIGHHTHPLELVATLEEADPSGATLATEAELDRFTWGVDFNKVGMVGKMAQVEARLRFTRP
jgi:polyisoprenoid-binding protein YceI